MLFHFITWYFSGLISFQTWDSDRLPEIVTFQLCFSVVITFEWGSLFGFTLLACIQMGTELRLRKGQWDLVSWHRTCWFWLIINCTIRSKLRALSSINSLIKTKPKASQAQKPWQLFFLCDKLKQSSLNETALSPWVTMIWSDQEHVSITCMLQLEYASTGSIANGNQRCLEWGWWWFGA